MMSMNPSAVMRARYPTYAKALRMEVGYGDFGEPITIITGIVVGVSALVGAGVSVASAVKAAQDRKQATRLTTLKRKRAAIKARKQNLAQRKAETAQAIQASRMKIAEAKAKASSRTPWVLYTGVAGVVLVSLIAAKAAKRA